MVEKNMKEIVPVGKQAHVRVSFEPKQEGAVVGNLIIHTIDGDFPIPIEGEATECIIRLEVETTVKEEEESSLSRSTRSSSSSSSSTVSFGTVGVGFERTKEVTVFNTCNLPITVNSFFQKQSHVADADKCTFVIHPAGPKTILANSSHKYTVTFSPAATRKEVKQEGEEEKKHHKQHKHHKHYPHKPHKPQKIHLHFQVVPEEQNGGGPQFFKFNPQAKQQLKLSGTSGTVNITMEPSDVLNVGVVPCLSPRETSILVTNTGTADVTVGVFDPMGGGMLSPSGHSYKGLGMICARPLSLFLKPGVTRSIALSVTVRTSGVVVLPLNLRLLGTKGGIVKEWQYLVQAEGEEPLISDRVLSIIENERLLCLLPVQSNDGEMEFQKLLEPRRVPTINDLYVMKGLLAPVRPMVWDGEFFFFQSLLCSSLSLFTFLPRMHMHTFHSSNHTTIHIFGLYRSTSSENKKFNEYSRAEPSF